MARYNESPPIEPIFVSVKDAAKTLSLTSWEVYKLLNEQKIASQYHGRRRLVSVESLREFAANLPVVKPEPADESA